MDRRCDNITSGTNKYWSISVFYCIPNKFPHVLHGELKIYQQFAIIYCCT